MVARFSESLHGLSSRNPLPPTSFKTGGRKKGTNPGAPKQYEPPRRGGQRSYDGDRLNPNGQIFDDNEKTKKAVY